MIVVSGVVVFIERGYGYRNNSDGELIRVKSFLWCLFNFYKVILCGKFCYLIFFSVFDS